MVDTKDAPYYTRSSPTLLSEEPNSVETDDFKQNDDWNKIRGHLESRLGSLRTWRASWWNQNWSDIARFILPSRSVWLTQNSSGIGSPNNMGRGKPINSAVVDPTATFAVRIAAAGLMSGLASPSRPWFKIRPANNQLDVDGDIQDGIDELEDRMYTVLSGSNFYNSFAQSCTDKIGFGSAPQIMYEDDQDIIRFYNPIVGEYYLAADSSGRINGLYRNFVMTTNQIVDFFGVENCPKSVQSMWASKGGSLETERIIAHAIEPNFEIGKGGVGVVDGGFAWREYYWVWGDGASNPLSVAGFHDRPFISNRWSVQSNDAYGRSPCMDILPDVMQLQVMTRRKAEGVEKIMRPPLVGDMSLKNQPCSTLPGHLTYVNGLTNQNAIRPVYQLNGDIVTPISQDIAQIQQRIKIGLFNDLFLMLESAPDNTQKTAYEIAQKVQEKMQVLGPVIEDSLSELKFVLIRLFNIMRRRGMLDDLPEQIRKMPLTIEFVSMLALAQKAAATTGIERLYSFAGNLMGVFPELRGLFDAETTMREYNSLLGNPNKLLFGPQEFAANKQTYMQQQNQQNQIQSANQIAVIANKMAPAAQNLSQTDVGGGQNALAAILGTSGGS